MQRAQTAYLRPAKIPEAYNRHLSTSPFYCTASPGLFTDDVHFSRVSIALGVAFHIYVFVLYTVCSHSLALACIVCVCWICALISNLSSWNQNIWRVEELCETWLRTEWCAYPERTSYIRINLYSRIEIPILYHGRVSKLIILWSSFWERN